MVHLQNQWLYQKQHYTQKKLMSKQCVKYNLEQFVIRHTAAKTEDFVKEIPNCILGENHYRKSFDIASFALIYFQLAFVFVRCNHSVTMSKIPSNGLVTPTQGQVNIECHLEAWKGPLCILPPTPKKKDCVSHACKNTFFYRKVVRQNNSNYCTSQDPI